MRKQSKAVSILKSQSGASFLFVLGIMLLLYAIGISTLTAAAANTGFMTEQETHNQLALLDDSIHRNILHSLRKDVDKVDSLSYQLVMAVVDACDGDSAYLGELSLELALTSPDSPDVDLSAYEPSITLNFPIQSVVITPAIPAVEEIRDEETGEILVEKMPRVPKTATADITMTVTVAFKADDKVIMTSMATYEYRGGRFSDDPDGLSHTYDTTGDGYALAFLSGGYGEWRLVKHERVET